MPSAQHVRPPPLPPIPAPPCVCDELARSDYTSCVSSVFMKCLMRVCSDTARAQMTAIVCADERTVSGEKNCGPRVALGLHRGAKKRPVWVSMGATV